MSDFTFKQLGECDISEWISLIESEPEETWTTYVMRNRGHQKDTQFIPIYWSKYLNSKRVPLESGQSIIRFEMSNFDKYKTLLNKFESEVSNVYGHCTLLKGMIIRLKPGGFITPHIDDMGLLKDTHRVHLPLITNSGVIMTCGTDNLSPPQPGHAFEINNTLEHSVRNTGDDWRVHLVVDFLDVDKYEVGITNAKVDSQDEYKEKLRDFYDNELLKE